MRRIVVWLASTAVAVALLFAYRTSLGGSTAPVVVHAQQPAGVVGAAPPSAAPPSAARTGRPSHEPRPNNAATTHATVVNGTVVQTVWGPVQVQVHVANGRITDIVPLAYPTGTSRDEQINSYALPQLRRQALAAQSAHIDGVSGATYTSDGYRRSLQAALDVAHLGS